MTLEGTGIDRSTLLTTGIVVSKNAESSADSNPESHANSVRFLRPSSIYVKKPDTIGALSEVVNLVQFAKKNHINLKLYINPTQTATYLCLNLDSWFGVLRRLSAISDYWDFSGLNSIASTNLSFHESSHFRLKTGDLIIARMFNHKGIRIPDDFGKYVTRDNVEEDILLHRALLRDYFACTRPVNDTRLQLDLSRLTRLKTQPTAAIKKINGIPVSPSDKAMVINTPWIRVEGSDLTFGGGESQEDLCVQIGDILFRTESNSHPGNNDEQEKKYSATENGWHALIPTARLPKGNLSVRLVAIRKHEPAYSLSAEATTVKIIPNQGIPSMNELTQLNGSATFHINQINGIQPSLFKTVYQNTTYLNLQGWAVDVEQNSISGGVLVDLDGQTYLSQFMPEREEIARQFHLTEKASPGWGITIPADSLKEGPHQLTFKVLNKQHTGYYPSDLKIQFRYCSLDAHQLLSGVLPSNNATKYAIDAINKTVVRKNRQLVIKSTANLTIKGWAVDTPGENLASNVIVDIDGKLFRADYGNSRPDVAEFLQNPVYNSCGWSVNIPVALIGKGEHLLSLKIIAHDQLKYFQVDQKVSFRIN
jgi:hypothetical protein